MFSLAAHASIDPMLSPLPKGYTERYASTDRLSTAFENQIKVAIAVICQVNFK